MASNNRRAASGPIPQQYMGKQVDLESRVLLTDKESAKRRFHLAKDRLLDINSWYETAELPVASFVLTDAQGGEAIRSMASEGDKVRIDIPGPGPVTGNGYDWVVVSEIGDFGDDICSITLRPTSNPLKPSNDTAHFFKESASSTLIVERQGNEVIARYHGRNETINSNTDSGIDNVRNTLVGTGAKLGLSYQQWKSLVAGLIKESP